MKKTYIDAEQTAEALLEALGKELGEARADFCEALMDPDREDPPMFMDEGYWSMLDDYEVEDFESWKAVQTPRKGGRGRLRRAFILVAVLILVLGLFAVAADGVKLKKNTMHMRETVGESTKLTDIDKTKFDVEDFEVTYVPEGYELVEDVSVENYVRNIKFSNEECTEVWIHIAETDHFGANVDNEVTKQKEVLVNDKQAYLFQEKNKNIVVWQMGNCTLDISGKLSEEDLIQVASHIYVK